MELLWVCIVLAGVSIVLIIVAAVLLATHQRGPRVEIVQGWAPPPVEINRKPELPADCVRLERELEVAGAFAAGRPEIIGRWAAGTGHRLELRRELGNPHDANAIAVIARGGGLGDGEAMIGYVPAEVSANLIAREIQGNELAPVVRRIWVGGQHRLVAYVRFDLVARKATKRRYGKQIGSR